MQRTSSSAASDKDEAAFYKRALHTAIDEFGSFIQENFILINDFEASNNNNNENNENNESENAPTTEDNPPTDAAVVVVQATISDEQAPAEAPAVEQGEGESSPTATATATAAEEAATVAGGDTTTTTATSASPPAPAPAAAKTRDVDALVQQLEEHIEQCVTFTTGTALLNESGAVTSCCSEQQLHAAVEQATRLLANVPRVLSAIDELLLLPPPPPSVAVDDVEKRQQQQQQAATVDAVLGNVAYGTRQFDAYLSVLAESVAKHMASARDATNEAAKPEQQQQLIATVDKQVSEMRDAVQRMSDALAQIQPLAQVDKVEVATESSAPVAGVEVQVEAEEHDIKKAITIG